MTKSKLKRHEAWNIATAAEAFAAALFALCKCKVSVQYGANQPEYDLTISCGNRVLKVSVKGSQDGSWGLTQGYKNKDCDYHQAAALWCEDHTVGTIICLVQFQNVPITEMPRIYLATPNEICDHMNNQRKGFGETILYENHTWIRGLGVGCVDSIPDSWRFSEIRVAELFEKVGLK